MRHPVVALVAAHTAPHALAQGFDQVNQKLMSFNTALITIAGIVVVTAIIWAALKMIFGHARLGDVANILVGGALIGGATYIGSFLVN